MGSTRWRILVSLTALTALLGTAGCGDDAPDAGGATGPPPPPELSFSPAALDLGEDRFGDLVLQNGGSGSAESVAVVPGPILDATGQTVPGSLVDVSPALVPELGPGASQVIRATLQLGAGIPVGSYTSAVEASLGGQPAASATISFVVQELATQITSLEITSPPASVTQGDPVDLVAVARDESGAAVTVPLAWNVTPAGAGLIDDTGRFVGYVPGVARVGVEAGGLVDSVDVAVAVRQTPVGSFTVAGRGEITTRITTDHWEHGAAAYVGTMGCAFPTPCGVFVWDVSNPASPVLTDSVMVAAGRVNDVKIREDGTLGILTQESTGGNGAITIFDLADPLHPVVITTFQSSALGPGVHNVWIDGDYVYVAVDGNSPSAGLKVLDISDPAAPTVVASYYAGSSNVHDVYVRDGLAFVSHWNAGLVILDVGNGIEGGSPTNPRVVSRVAFSFPYAVHNAWYWPEAGYLFAGDEFDQPGRGFVSVVDVSDLRNPVEVAEFRASGAAPHNFWIDESRGIAYFAWYENGLQAVDVSGALFGELHRQNRKIADSRYAGPGACGTGGTCTWAPQLHQGKLYVSDLHSGLWVLDPDF